MKGKRKITVAVAGNPNSGKTTIFNLITGSAQKVGNWTGVTVERVEGERKYENHILKFVDLPGTYSLSAFSPEEKVARDFLLYEYPDVVLVVVDASHLERNLYLVAQLVDIGHPMVVALNMFDLAAESGYEIDVEKLSLLLGVPVVPTIATKNYGIGNLLREIVRVAENQIHPKPLIYPPDIEDAIQQVSERIKIFNNNSELFAGCHIRKYVATKLIEEDPEISAQIISVSPEGEKIKEFIHQKRLELERLYQDDIHSILAQARFAWAAGLFGETVKISKRKKFAQIGDKIDNIVLNKWLGFPIFAAVMFLMFYLTFTIGGFFADYIDKFFGWLGDVSREFIISHFHSPLFASLVSDGIIGGVGGVLVFLPNIFILFLLIALIEDSGYVARAAFLMDKIMHKFGLHGRSFIPMLLGFGCSVPAIISTRALRDPRDRLATMLIIPFIPCSARLPVLILFAGILFPKNPTIVVFGMYFLGIAVAVLMATVIKKLFMGGLTPPFVMELPKYHIPAWRVVLKHAAIHTGAFVRKAGTVILLGAILMWMLGSLPFGVEYASEQSVAGKIGKFLQPVFAPQHFEWKGIVALSFGFIAKEIIVSTLNVLYGADEENLADELAKKFPPPVGWAFLIFAMLYTPCLATLAAIKAETGSVKWAFVSVALSLSVAWVLSAAAYYIVALA